MDGFLEWLAGVINSINDFLTWYFNETPLFEDTLDSLYDVVVHTTQQMIPLIGEYIEYISEYIKGASL